MAISKNQPTNQPTNHSLFSTILLRSFWEGFPTIFWSSECLRSCGHFLGRDFWDREISKHLQAPLPNLTKYPCKETRKRPINLSIKEHRSERIDGDRSNPQVRWRIGTGITDKPRLMGVASSTFQLVYFQEMCPFFNVKTHIETKSEIQVVKET